MGKQKINIEHPLPAKSPAIVWELISSAHGLKRWLANDVTATDGTYTFTWGELWAEHDTKRSQLLEYEKHGHIRLKWDDDDEEDSYWEMRIEKSELTGQLNLLITDFAEPGEADDLRALWYDNLARLHEASGL